MKTSENITLQTVGALAALALTACSGSTTRHLDPQNLALTSKMAAAFGMGENAVYESYVGVNLPIVKPTQKDLTALKGAVGPFDHHPWITTGDVKCQLTWTLANLDPDPHTVELLVDPWNEFGRYVPGVVVMNDNTQPNLSGYDEAYDVPGLMNGKTSSRIEHTLSFDDMDEVATDFATTINIFAKVMPTPATATMAAVDPRIGLVNHAFNVQNHSGSDPLTDRYRPPVVPALVGFNLGLRSTEKANLVLEYAVEIVDNQGNRVVEEGSTTATLQAPGKTFTLGGG